jgi:small-conductance mechanosensitive channel
MRDHAHASRRSPGLLRALAVVPLLLTFTVAAPAFGQPPATVQEARTSPVPPGVPVKLDGDVLFYIRQGIGALTPAERANTVDERLIRIAKDPFYSADQITIQDKGNTAEVYYRGTMVGFITKEDAAQFGPGTPAEEATKVVRKITASIDAYRARRLPAAVRRAVILAMVATLVFVGLLMIARRIDGRLVARVRASLQEARPGTVVTTMVRTLDKTASLQLRALRLLRFGLTALLVVAYLLVIFNLFPLTRAYVISFGAYILDPVRVVADGIWSNVGNFIFIIVITILARYLLKGLRLLLSEAAAGAITLPGVQPDWAMLLYKALRVAVVAIALVVVYPYIPGSSTEAFKGIGIFAGALFTLGATGMAGNLIGGLALMFTRTFRIGDRVKIGDVVGDVLETTLMMTRVRSLRNEIVTIPNSAIMNGHVIDYSARARAEGLVLTTEVTIGYNAPWRTVHALLVDAALRTPRILAQPAPFVLQKSLNDFHVSYVIWAYTGDANAMHLTYGELHQNIQDAFNEGGIEILSPSYGYLRDGNATTIPPSYLPAGYQPEPFRVQMDVRPDAGAAPGGSHAKKD